MQFQLKGVTIYHDTNNHRYIACNMWGYIVEDAMTLETLQENLRFRGYIPTSFVSFVNDPEQFLKPVQIWTRG